MTAFELTYRLRGEIDGPKIRFSIFLDLSNAFEKLDHDKACLVLKFLNWS